MERYCSSCGAKMDSGTTFCENCGNHMQHEESVFKKFRKHVITGITVFAAIAFVLIVLVSNSENETVYISATSMSEITNKTNTCLALAVIEHEDGTVEETQYVVLKTNAAPSDYIFGTSVFSFVFLLAALGLVGEGWGALCALFLWSAYGYQYKVQLKDQTYMIPSDGGGNDLEIDQLYAGIMQAKNLKTS